jgi:mono/diheme cytochrome c family protein
VFVKNRVQPRVALVVLVALGSLTTVGFAATPNEHDPGYAVYDKWCAPCHAPGISHPGTNALTEKYKGVKSGVLLEWTDLPPVVVKHWVRTGISVMPQFRKTEISDAELEALARFLARNTRDSHG